MKLFPLFLQLRRVLLHKRFRSPDILVRDPACDGNDFTRAELDLENGSSSRNVNMWRRMIARIHANGETALADDRRH
jgi:hypothetical protein